MLNSLTSAEPMRLATSGRALPVLESPTGAVRIPLRNRSGVVVAQTIVSEEDGALAAAYGFAALALHREFAATNFQYFDRTRTEAVGTAHLFPCGPRVDEVHEQ